MEYVTIDWPYIKREVVSAIRKFFFLFTFTWTLIRHGRSRAIEHARDVWGDEGL